MRVSAVLGLGNPGRRYARNRHNIGFMVIDRLAFLKSEEFIKGDGPFEFCRIAVDSNSIILCKSTTYMNDTGRAAVNICDYFGIPATQLLAICDDCNLPLGKIRYRRWGSDGGHNGLQSIIDHLQNKEFPRLRLGIGLNPPDKALEDYVLDDFAREEIKIVENVIARACDFIVELAVLGSSRSSVTINVTED